MLLPVSPVEGMDLESVKQIPIQAPEVHIVVVGVRARSVERCDATDPAEVVARCVRVEGVGRKRVFSAQQLEMCRWDDKVNVALLGADRAVALLGPPTCHPDAESKRAAVAASFIAGKIGHGEIV